MNKIILAPDSFKETMSSTEICHIMKQEILTAFPKCTVISIPVADGGEGTVDCFLEAMPGKKIKTIVKGPHYEDIESFYGIVDKGKTAIVEMAAAAGLSMVGENKNPILTTTYGVGQLARHAIKQGATNIIVGLGGSSTNDGGCGMAAALGVRFFNKEGKEFVPVGGTLDEIVAIDVSDARKLLKSVRLIAMCDVNNTLYGKSGAAYIYGPQKGADKIMIDLLDSKLMHFGSMIDTIPGKHDVSALPGAGAAGGMGAGMYSLLDAELVPGIEAVLDTVHFDDLLSGCDLVFTGEGRIDGQSLRGKVVIGIARRAKKKAVPVCAVVGESLDETLTSSYDEGVTAIFTINRLAIPLCEAKLRTKTNLRYTMQNIIRLIRSVDTKY